MSYKLYYKKDSGIVCGLPPYNYTSDENDLFIEVGESEYTDAHLIPYGKVWKVVDNKLTLEDDETTINSKEYQLFKLENDLAECKGYLTKTDYIVIKLSEIKLDDEAKYEEEKAQYEDILAKRKENREKINKIEESISILKEKGLKWL